MNKAYLLLGSNLDDRKGLIRKAVQLISVRIGTIIQTSSLYESEPWGFSSDTNFLNQVVYIRTDLSPSVLLREILAVEKDLGRIRSNGRQGYSSRTIDIDILFYNEEIIREEHLNIPHPGIPVRMFALVPLCELNESFVHPVCQKTLGLLKAECTDRTEVVKYESSTDSQYVE